MIQNISIIGSGNVATHLAQGFTKKGITIDAVYSSHFENANLLANQINTSTCHRLKDLPASSDLYLISIPDDQIESVMHEVIKIAEAGAIIAHTSGSTPTIKLNPEFSSAVLYPLQTFSKQREMDLCSVPFLISADKKTISIALMELSKKVTGHTREISDQERIYLHIAAVFTNNFTNHLFTIAEELANKYQLDFNLLRPLIAETTRKVESALPSEVQTGPARRNDQKTIEKHLEILEGNEKYQELYSKLSVSIFDFYNRKD